MTPRALYETSASVMFLHSLAVKADCVTTLHEVCPSLKAPPDAPSSPCFWRMHRYDPLWPHISQEKKMATLHGVYRHFCRPGRQKS